MKCLLYYDNSIDFFVTGTCKYKHTNKAEMTLFYSFYRYKLHACINKKVINDS